VLLALGQKITEHFGSIPELFVAEDILHGRVAPEQTRDLAVLQLRTLAEDDDRHVVGVGHLDLDTAAPGRGNGDHDQKRSQLADLAPLGVIDIGGGEVGVLDRVVVFVGHEGSRSEFGGHIRQGDVGVLDQDLLLGSQFGQGTTDIGTESAVHWRPPGWGGRNCCYIIIK